jgi:hypothetical protein
MSKQSLISFTKEYLKQATPSEWLASATMSAFISFHIHDGGDWPFANYQAKKFTSPPVVAPVSEAILPLAHQYSSLIASASSTMRLLCNGKANARAIRGHLWVESALTKVLLKSHACCRTYNVLWYRSDAERFQLLNDELAIVKRTVKMLLKDKMVVSDSVIDELKVMSVCQQLELFD